MFSDHALRPYQQDAIQALTTDHGRHRRVLLALPTGTGKTRTAAAYALSRFLRRHERVVWVAHSDELLTQAARAFQSLGWSADAICRRHGRWNDTRTHSDAPLWFINNLVDERSAPSKCSLLIIDEAHHAAGESYKRWLSRYRAHSSDGARVLGLTATPYRMHQGTQEKLTAFMYSKPLVPIFEKISYERSFNSLAAAGFLAPFRLTRVNTQMAFKMALDDRGDVSGESLKALDTKERNRLIVDLWRRNKNEYGTTLIFVGTKDHAKHLKEAFGNDAEYVVSGGDREERDDAIERFRRGEVPVLVNVGIFREGVDVPRIKAVVLARPTASAALFTQMVGRGARILADKRHFHLVDIHDQLGDFEEYLCGVEVLGTDEQIVHAVTSRASVAESMSGSPLGSLLRDRRVLTELAAALQSGGLVHYEGWVTFRTGEGESISMGALLTPEDYAGLSALATDGMLTSERARDVNTAAHKASSRALWKCARALSEGLQGRLHSFRALDPSSTTALLQQAATGLNLPSGAPLAELAVTIRRTEEKLQDWGFAEREIASVLEAFLATPAAYGGVLKVRGEDGAFEARLLTKASWNVVSDAVGRAIEGRLSFADAPRILEQLGALEPDLAEHGRSLLDAIASATSATSVAISLTTPTTAGCSRCGALFLPDPTRRFCSYCGAPTEGGAA